MVFVQDKKTQKQYWNSKRYELLHDITKDEENPDLLEAIRNEKLAITMDLAKTLPTQMR